MPDDIEDFKARYMRRLDNELGNPVSMMQETSSNEYEQFKQEYLPAHRSLYEKLCRISGSILKLGPGKKNEKDMEIAIRTTHLNITPVDAQSFAVLGPLIFMVFGSILGFILPSLLSPRATDGSIFMVFFVFITGLIMIYPLMKMPFFMANKWRLEASNQMVLAVFYIVTYMRHTSNLELAIDFAAEHLEPPLSLDMKKVIWDIETGKHDSIKDSLNSYLDNWKDWNKEFIESIHLVESSLYENSESRRLDALEKALDVMLNETYEKMLHYAHGLKSPLQALHMLGIVLPILGLVILPLMVSFIPEVDWYHIMVLYNLALPIGVYYLGKNILSKRPTGYGETRMTDDSANQKRFRNILLNIGKTEISINPLWTSVLIFGILLFIGIFPLVYHLAAPMSDWVMTDVGFQQINGYQNENALFYFLGYRPLIVDGEIQDAFIGPFGLGATILSLFIPLAFGLGLGSYYKFRSKNVIKIRDRSKKLEEEFASALFQLGNRLADGIPAEIAFEKVAVTMEDTVSGKFFRLVSVNISKLGLGLEQAIFDSKKGALAYYPSNMIESSMKVLLQASKKGPLVASQALINVSEYIKEMHRVDERLRDLMADIVSDMKSQISFLTPAIAGIVVGITSMITKILGSLGENLSRLESDAAAGASGGVGSGLLDLFGTGMPTFWFQAIVGVYVVQVVFILTVLVNGIEHGSDKVLEQSMLGKYLVKTTLTYCIIAGIVTLLFNLIGGTIITPAAAGG